MDYDIKELQQEYRPLWSLLHKCKNVETSRNPVYSYLYITMPNTFGYIFILKVIYHFHLS